MFKSYLWKSSYKQITRNSELFIKRLLCFQFSLCIEDLVPLALGRYVKALISSIQRNTVPPPSPDHAIERLFTLSSSDHILEKLFTLFIEQGNLWPEICSLPEIKSPETSESSLYGYDSFIDFFFFPRGSIYLLNYQ